MANIVVAGLGEDQSIHLVRSRPAEGPLKAGEYPHKDKSGKLLAYRKDLPKSESGNSTLPWIKLHKIFGKEWNNEGKPKSWSYSLLISNQSGSHLVNLGGGMVAGNVINSFFSLLNKTPEEIAEMTFKIEFYHNKKTGYNSAMVHTGSGERLDWYMSPEEEKSYKDNHGKDPRNPTKDIIVKDRLHARYLELIEALNQILPHSQSEWVSALDGIDDDEDGAHGVTADDAEELFGDAPATASRALNSSSPSATQTSVADKPFEV